MLQFIPSHVTQVIISKHKHKMDISPLSVASNISYARDSEHSHRGLMRSGASPPAWPCCMMLSLAISAQQSPFPLSSSVFLQTDTLHVLISLHGILPDHTSIFTSNNILHFTSSGKSSCEPQNK